MEETVQSRAQLVERLCSLSSESPLSKAEIQSLEDCGLWSIWTRAVEQAKKLVKEEAQIDPRFTEAPLLTGWVIEGEANLADGRSFRDVRRDCFLRALRLREEEEIFILRNEMRRLKVLGYSWCSFWSKDHMLKLLKEYGGDPDILKKA